jgi:hypothetical protein
MKSIITTFFLIFSITVKSQTTDIMYVPDQKSLVATYTPNYSPVGFYIGGYFTTSFPEPYIYTTPLSIMNRIGLSFSNGQFALMGGAFVKSYVDSLSFKPDIWFNIYPLRIITNTKKGFDFTVGINYMDKIRYGVGLSIPFGGIYNDERNRNYNR